MPTKIPAFVKDFFWDSDIDTLVWEDHRDFIIRRLLQVGSWPALRWLRTEIDDAELRRWIEQRRGAGLSPRQLRFWQVVLDIPATRVTRWVHAAAARPWERRLIQ